MTKVSGYITTLGIFGIIAESGYTSIADTTYLYLDDGIIYIRKGIRSGYLVTDITITAIGFDGTEGTDWSNLTSVTL